MLNACLKLPSSTNQIPLYIHTQAYPSLSLPLSFKTKTRNPKKATKTPRVWELVVGLGYHFVCLFVLFSVLCNGCGGGGVFLFRFRQWPCCPWSQRGTFSPCISKSRSFLGSHTQMWEHQYNVALSLLRKRQTGWSQAIYIYNYKLILLYIKYQISNIVSLKNFHTLFLFFFFFGFLFVPKISKEGGGGGAALYGSSSVMNTWVFIHYRIPKCERRWKCIKHFFYVFFRLPNVVPVFLYLMLLRWRWCMFFSNFP